MTYFILKHVPSLLGCKRLHIFSTLIVFLFCMLWVSIIEQDSGDF